MSRYASDAARGAYEKENVWPEGKMPDVRTNQCTPYLEWFEAPAQPNGACMILVSGGSYQVCCDVWLIKLWKETFTKLGYQTVNLV